MVRWFAVFAALLLVISSSFGQGFVVTWNYLDTGGAPLTTTCNGNTGLPDGRLIKIFWDTNSNGPDPSDPLAVLCDVPPACETGPIGTVNLNTFLTNGVSVDLGAGYFAAEQAFQSALGMPPTPTYYLRIYEADGTTILWTSTTRTLTSGPQDVYFNRSDWTCGAGGPQCVVRDEHE